MRRNVDLAVISQTTGIALTKERGNNKKQRHRITLNFAKWKYLEG